MSEEHIYKCTGCSTEKALPEHIGDFYRDLTKPCPKCYETSYVYVGKTTDVSEKML